MRGKVGNDFKLGKTIVGARGRSRELELKRIEERKKLRRRNIIVGCLIGAICAGLVAWGVVGIIGMLNEQDEVVSNKEVTWTPTVDIVSEGGGKSSERVKEFVAKMEKDFKDLGFAVSRAVLPLGTMREVDVYIDGRIEYYKMTVDRGTAVQAEDAERMMRYLDENSLAPEYVDLRVEGKAYLK